MRCIDIRGTERSRASTRWLPTPRTTSLLVNLPFAHSCLKAVATVEGSTTSPRTTAPSGRKIDANRTILGRGFVAWPFRPREFPNY